MKKSNWIWMPHAGHLIVGHKCRFKLNTYVGDYVVSTVGEWVPEEISRNMEVELKKDKPLGKGDENEYEYLRRYGFKEIGAYRTYETMVFKAKKSDYKCCPYEIIVTEEVDMEGYNSAEDAYEGHLKLCKKWSMKGDKK